MNEQGAHEFGEEYAQLSQLLGDHKRNLLEVIQLVIKQANLQNADISKSIAVIDSGKLMICIIYGNNQQFKQTYSVDSESTKELLSEASRLIADNMRDSVERLRRIESADK